MCKLMFAQNRYMARLIFLVISSFLFVQYCSLSANAADKWVVSETPDLKSQDNVLLPAAVNTANVIETSGFDIKNGIQIYSFNSRQLVTTLAKTTNFNVVGENKDWVYVTVSGYPVWVHIDYVEREQGQIRVIVQEGKLNLRKEPDKYAMTLGAATNGYRTIELDYKDPWVKIVAPESLKFAIKKADFNNLGKSGAVATSDAVSEAKLADNVVEQQAVVAEQSIVPEVASIKEVAPIKKVSPKPVKTSYANASIYKLTPGDVISIQVYGESELSINQVRIPEGGVISFPLIGQIKVAAKTAVAIENLVSRRLADGYIRNPKVSLTIDNYRPIYIRGAVESSGAFPFTGGLTIAKAITLAGGAIKAANFEGVSLIRRDIAVDGSLSIDSQKLVQPGDIISVSEEVGGASEDANESIYLHGEVRSPGGYDFRRGLTVEKAVALAGGFSIRASKRRINISRQMPEQEQPVKLKKVDLYFPVEPGDVISIGASWF